MNTPLHLPIYEMHIWVKSVPDVTRWRACGSADVVLMAAGVECALLSRVTSLLTLTLVCAPDRETPSAGRFATLLLVRFRPLSSALTTLVRAGCGRRCRCGRWGWG